mgnify:CR=1 FL=1
MLRRTLLLCLSLMAPGLSMSQDLVKLKAGMVAGIDQIGLPIALERGFFEKHGLDVTISRPYATGVDALNALQAGENDTVQVGVPMIGAVLRGMDLVALGNYSGSANKLGADIAIDKRIPSQAGMGGGSSDAASTLLALNRLWQLNLPRPQLEQLGLQLGADVPFFLRGHNAWVEGIGERITPVALPPARFAVLKPAAGVDTASIFRHPQLERATKPATIANFAADPYGFGHNDLQPVAQALCPEVSQALALLQSLGLQARMTGSGSAVFAHLASPGHAAIQAPDHWVARECGNLEVHPLQGWAASDN